MERAGSVPWMNRLHDFFFVEDTSLKIPICFLSEGPMTEVVKEQVSRYALFQESDMAKKKGKKKGKTAKKSKKRSKK